MMAGLGKFLLGVAGYMALILLLAWLGFVAETWLGDGEGAAGSRTSGSGGWNWDD